tara:strand:+ start:7421 stop:7597 length:177 start_codon:yes stop_codon:yes gene_type:complete
MLTLQDLKTKMMQLDEVTLIELLQASSEEIVNRFADRIENNFEEYTGEFDDHLPWDND